MPDQTAQSRDEILAKVTTDDITKLYTGGHIDHGEYKSMLREKALYENRKAFGNEGYMMTFYHKTLEEVQKGWDKIKEAATHEQGADASALKNTWTEIYNVGLAVMGQIQILNSIPAAAGEMAGLEAERLSLQMGADPSLAKFIGITANVGSGFVPSLAVAKGTQLGIKGVGAAKAALSPTQKGAQLALNLEGTATATTGAGAIAAPEIGSAATDLAQKVVHKAISTSLASEGIESQALKVIEKDIGQGVAAAGAAAKSGAKVPPKPNYVGTETGSVIDTTTGEVIPKYLQTPAMEAKAATAKAAGTLTPRAVAGEIAEQKLGVPKDQVHNLLTEWAPEQIAKGDIEGAATKFADDISKLSPEQLSMFKKGMEAAAGEEGAVNVGMLAAPFQNAPSIYRNILLASPVGRIKDVMSNMGATANYLAQRQMGVMVGGSGETTTRGTIAYAKGLALSIGEGMQAFKSAFQAGGLQGMTRFGTPIGGGQAVNVPTALTVGIDRFFKAINTRAALYANEMEAAIKNGRAFDIANVNSPTKSMLEAAMEHADYVTYQNDLGAMGKALLQGAAGASKYTGGLSEMYFPFLKTPINLMKYAWNNTPGLQVASGRLWSEILGGGAAADAAMGRLVISNMFGYYISEMVKNDMITGAGPADPEMRAAWLKTHQPYSARVGDTWVPLNFAAPFAHAVGMIADYTYFTQSPHDPADAGKASLAILMTVHQNMGTNSWWDEFTKLSDAFNTKAQSDTAVRQVGKALAAPFVTLATGGQPGALLKQALDPVTRDAQGIFEQWRAKMPGWSPEQPPDYDGYGDKIVPPAALISRWGASTVMPIKTKESSKEAIHIEGDRLKVKLPFRANSIGGSPHELDMKELRPGDKVGVGLSTQQVAERDQYYGNKLQDNLENLMKNQLYQDAPDPVKRQWFEGQAHDALTWANTAIQLKHPELGIQVLQQDAARQLPKAMNDQQRYDMQRAYANSIGYFESLTPDQVNNILRFTTPSSPEDDTQ